MLPETLERRISRDADGCWRWHGGTHPLGYGMAYFERRQHFAHRLIYSLLVGPIPEGRQIHHRCETRSCVNPEHLAAVTPKEHSGYHLIKTHCKHGHEFTPENVYVYRRPGRRDERRCRECQRVAGRRYQLALRTNRV